MFDDFSVILLEVGRGAVPGYEHIYFLDRSRCLLSDFSKIWLGLGDKWLDGLKIQLQAQGATRVSRVGVGPADGRGGAKPKVARESNRGMRQDM